MNRLQFQQRQPIDWKDNQDYYYNENGLYYYFDCDYQQYFYFDEKIQNELCYQNNEYYPAERTIRSQVEILPNRNPIIRKQPGEGKFQIRLSRFETDAQEYDIVRDLENMKPNINFAQSVAAAP
ncbi:unnamed protein product [Rhizophagus irregularis]|nr:unnamed protein product [Rhizophagus irregularis]CAB4446595.1 unnamed protein product [Rhizophagus irregularis]